MSDRRTDSGIEVRQLYTSSDLHDGTHLEDRLGRPGSYPFTRGSFPLSYHERPWTIRQYSGYGTAEQTNARWRMLLAAGGTGLSCAFDLPTQMGYDSDHPMAEGEVGRVGVAIDSIDDMRALLSGLPLDRVSVSMTINSTAAILLLLFELVAEEEGFDAAKLHGTVQNDILKEYIARGTYIYPPRPSMRLVTDLFAYCHERLPHWNPISVSGYHIREAGSSAAQELAFTLSDAIAYLDAAKDAGLPVGPVAERCSFFWNSHSNLFEEVAKFRAARRMWAKLIAQRYGIEDDKAQRMRFHTQTAGSTLTAQQPENNAVRITLQALAAVLGGTQSLHTNSFDEALGLPTEHAARLAVRTQQILAHETGVGDTIDPLGGSWYVESLTDALEAAASDLISEVDALGGALAAIEDGFQQAEIERNAYETATAVERDEKVIVGVNRFKASDSEDVAVFPYDREQTEAQVQRVKSTRASRSSADVLQALRQIEHAAKGSKNLLYPIKEALALKATIGEVSDALRSVFGEHRTFH